MIHVSCICPTYNRAPNFLHLLGEAVESFRRQIIPEGVKAELLILNDAPGQILTCQVPDVRIVNLNQRIQSLGEKYNVAIELAKGDVILPWEDDDISLPLRIKQSIGQIFGTLRLSYWKPPQVWFMDSTGLHWHHNVGVRHHASAFTRWAWQSVGGYPKVSGNQDALMDQKLNNGMLPSYPFGIPPNEWQYLYRFGVTPNHLSGFPNHEAAWHTEGQKPIAKGTFEIVPKWNRDYEELCKSTLATIEDQPA